MRLAIVPSPWWVLLPNYLTKSQDLPYKTNKQTKKTKMEHAACSLFQSPVHWRHSPWSSEPSLLPQLVHPQLPLWNTLIALTSHCFQSTCLVLCPKYCLHRFLIEKMKPLSPCWPTSSTCCARLSLWDWLRGSWAFVSRPKESSVQQPQKKQWWLSSQTWELCPDPLHFETGPAYSQPSSTQVKTVPRDPPITRFWAEGSLHGKWLALGHISS